MPGTGPARKRSGGAGDEGGDDVAGVAIEVLSSSVVASGCARVGMAGCDLCVAQGHSGVERGGDEAVPERVGRDVLGEPGAFRKAAHDAGCAVPVHIAG